MSIFFDVDLSLQSPLHRNQMIAWPYQRESFQVRAIPLSIPYVAMAIQTTFTAPEG